MRALEQLEWKNHGGTPRLDGWLVSLLELIVTGSHADDALRHGTSYCMLYCLGDSYFHRM